MPICKLCLKDKPLIAKSHILPNAIYERGGLYNEYHKLHQFNPSDLLKDNPRIKMQSTGIYEGGLLCAECDNEIIGSYESYGCPILYAKANENPLPAKLTPNVQNYVNQYNQRFNIVGNIDYGKFKLFLLSILFRADISSHEAFKEVDLGPVNRERIRKMLYEGAPGNLYDFPISFQSYLHDNTAKDIIIAPRRTRIEGIISYIFTITGMFYIFHITHGRPLDKQLEMFTVRPEGNFTVLHVENGSGMNHMLRLANAI